MLPYWLFFGLFAFGAMLTHPSPIRQKPMGLLWFGALAMVVIVGLRFHVGVDWANYHDQWTAAPQMGLTRFLNSYPGDPVFYAIEWVLASSDFSFWTLNLMCALVYVAGLFSFARRQANPWLAVAVAVPYLTLVIAMSGLRQATAVGFVFLALVAFTRMRTVAFIGWTICAAAFHASAIILIPLAGLSFARSRVQAVMLLIVIAAVAYFVLGSTFGEYSRDYLGKARVQSSGTIYRIAMSLLAAGVYFAIRKRVTLEDHERTLWRNFALLTLACVPAFLMVPSSTAVDRVLLYLFPLQIFALSHAPSALNRASGQRSMLVMCILAYQAAILVVFLNYAVNRHSYIPYRNYLTVFAS